MYRPSGHVVESLDPGGRRAREVGVVAPETVTEAIQLLEADGFRTGFSLSDGTVRCSGCGASHPPRQLVVRRTFRFEGVSDPGDEAIVLGVECPDCHARGIVVSAFGPDADSQLITLVNGLIT